MGDAALALTAEAAAGNSSINNTVNAIGHWQYATAAENATLTTLYALASNLYDANVAAATAAAASASAATQSYIATQLTDAAVAYASYAGVDPTNSSALTASLTKSLYVSLVASLMFITELVDL